MEIYLLMCWYSGCLKQATYSLIYRYLCYNYAPDGTNIIVLSYFHYCVYWYTYEYFVKWFVDTLGNILHVNFLLFAHWFISIGILQISYNSISVDHDRYDTYIVDKDLDTSTVNKSTKFYKTTLSSDTIFTKYDVSTNYEQVEKLTR